MTDTNPVTGLHHITLVSSDAQRTVDFYTRVLGMRLIKKTVNFDDPGSYHLYFGSQSGQPGSVVTFFEWRDAQRGFPGIGGTHHVAFQVGDDLGLLKWKRWLTDLGIPVTGPLDRNYFHSIYFRDPDGAILEIATVGPGWTIDEAPALIGAEFREPPAEMMIANRDEKRIQKTTWPDPVPLISADMALSRGLHHLTAIGSDIQRTHAFYADLLGLRRVKMTSNFDDPSSAHWYWGDPDGKPGTIITYFERKSGRDRRARIGAGQTHHFALAVADAQAQLEWREKLLSAGLRVSPSWTASTSKASTPTIPMVISSSLPPLALVLQSTNRLPP